MMGQIGLRNRILGGGPDPPLEKKTNFLGLYCSAIQERMRHVGDAACFSQIAV